MWIVDTLAPEAEVDIWAWRSTDKSFVGFVEAKMKTFEENHVWHRLLASNGKLISRVHFICVSLELTCDSLALANEAERIPVQRLGNKWGFYSNIHWQEKLRFVQRWTNGTNGFVVASHGWNKIDEFACRSHRALLQSDIKLGHWPFTYLLCSNPIRCPVALLLAPILSARIDFIRF